jgi:hypothetical protein
MPATLPLVIHERLATWTRQLRPHAAAGWPVRLVETRSARELIDAVSTSQAPAVLVVGLGDDPAGELLAVANALAAAPETLSLVLDPIGGRPGVIDLAREIGATAAWGPEALPPQVVRMVRRLIDLAATRQSAIGWFVPAPNPAPDDLDAWLQTL